MLYLAKLAVRIVVIFILLQFHRIIEMQLANAPLLSDIDLGCI